MNQILFSQSRLDDTKELTAPPFSSEIRMSTLTAQQNLNHLKGHYEISKTQNVALSVKSSLLHW